MCLEVKIGDRPQISAEVWGIGARLFFGPTGISLEKLEPGGRWATDLLLLGAHVDLNADLVALLNPKIAGASNLINGKVFDRGNCVVSLHDIQESRGTSTTVPTLVEFGNG